MQIRNKPVLDAMVLISRNIKTLRYHENLYILYASKKSMAICAGNHTQTAMLNWDSWLLTIQ